MRSILRDALLDGTKGSFGRTVSLPFLLTAWVLGTAQGCVALFQGHSVSGGVWDFALIAAALYGGSKGLSVVREGMEGRKNNYTSGNEALHDEDRQLPDRPKNRINSGSEEGVPVLGSPLAGGNQNSDPAGDHDVGSGRSGGQEGP